MTMQAQPTPREDRPLNILLVHCHYNLPGGEDAVFADEVKALRAHGHSVVLYERSNTESTGEQASLGQKLLLPFRAIYSFKTVREVRKLIRENAIDVVHVHNTLLVISPSVFAAARAEGVPVVQTLHNFRLFCPGGVLLCDGKVCEACPRHGLSCAIRHRCYRGSLAQSIGCTAVYAIHRLLGTYRHVNLIALTEFDREKFLEFNERHPVFDPEKMYVKGNMVQLEGEILPKPLPLYPAQAENGRRKNIIVYAGRLEELKGLRCAIEAWQMMKDDTTAPKLVVCGAGPMETWAKKAAEGCNIDFLGQVPWETLQALLQICRAALVPSLCYESFALVPAEAHMLGTPVLASMVGNVGASVTHRVDGLRFARGDAEALYKSVQNLPELEATADPIAMQRDAYKQFNPELNYRRLNAIYRRIVAENTAKQSDAAQ